MVRVSRIEGRVEKNADEYDSPEARTVQATKRPLGETRARLGVPASGKARLVRRSTRTHR